MEKDDSLIEDAEESRRMALLLSAAINVGESLQRKILLNLSEAAAPRGLLQESTERKQDTSSSRLALSDVFPLPGGPVKQAKRRREKRKLDITTNGVLIDSSNGRCIKYTDSSKMKSVHHLKSGCPELFVLCHKLKAYVAMLAKKEESLETAPPVADQASSGKDNEDTSSSLQLQPCLRLPSPSTSYSVPSNMFENSLRFLSSFLCCQSTSFVSVMREVLESGSIVKVYPLESIVTEYGSFPLMGLMKGLHQAMTGLNIVRASLLAMFTQSIPVAEFQTFVSFLVSIERDRLLYMRQSNSMTASFTWKSSGLLSFGYSEEVKISGLFRATFSPAGLIKYISVYFDPNVLLRQAKQPHPTDVNPSAGGTVSTISSSSSAAATSALSTFKPI